MRGRGWVFYGYDSQVMTSILHETRNVKITCSGELLIHQNLECSKYDSKNSYLARSPPPMPYFTSSLHSMVVGLPLYSVRTALQAPDSAASQLAHTLRSLVGFPPDFDGSKPEPTSLYESRGQTDCGAVKLLISEFWNGIKKMHLNRVKFLFSRQSCSLFL